MSTLAFTSPLPLPISSSTTPTNHHSYRTLTAVQANSSSSDNRRSGSNPGHRSQNERRHFRSRRQQPSQIRSQSQQRRDDRETSQRYLDESKSGLDYVPEVENQEDESIQDTEVDLSNDTEISDISSPLNPTRELSLEKVSSTSEPNIKYGPQSDNEDNDGIDDENDNESSPLSNTDEKPKTENESLIDQGTDLDDSIDDGFFSRYRKDVNSLNSNQDQPSTSAGSRPRHFYSSNRANKEAASSAFDAVDRLFGSAELTRGGSSYSARTSSSQLRTTRPQSGQRFKRSADDPLNSNGGSSSQIDRRTWLENVKARAATTSAKSSPKQELTVPTSDQEKDIDTVDVDAVEDVNADTVIDQTDDALNHNEGAGESDDNLSSDNYDNDDSSVAPKKEYFISGQDDNDTLRKPKPHQQQRQQQQEQIQRTATPIRASRRQPRFLNGKDESTNRRPRSRDVDGTEPTDCLTQFNDDTFQLLMKVARQGPVGDATLGAKRKTARPTRGSNSSYSSSSNRGGATLAAMANDQTPTEYNTPVGSGSSGGDGSSGSTRMRKSVDSERRKGGVSQRLNEIISGKSSGVVPHDDDFEPSDDEMEYVIDVGQHAAQWSPRQSYSSVRRHIPKPRQVIEPPKEWQPLAVEGVENIVSDKRQLRNAGAAGNGFTSHAAGTISDCSSCSGSGMETCAVCVGEGWIPSLSVVNASSDIDSDRAKLLDEIWMMPNLVVNMSGEAQCVRCNSVGKQFCSRCEGSGSSLSKGFDLSEKYKVFDMFGGSEHGPPDVDIEELLRTMGSDEDDDDDDDEDDDDDDDEGEDEDGSNELESFQLYTGSADMLNILGQNGARKDLVKTEAPGEADDVVDIGAEDESEEFLATLEAMHIADLEDRGPSLDKRLGIRRRPLRVRDVDDDVVPVDEDEDEDDESEDGDLGMVVDDVNDVDDIDDVDDVDIDDYELDDDDDADLDVADDANLNVDDEADLDVNDDVDLDVNDDVDLDVNDDVDLDVRDDTNLDVDDDNTDENVLQKRMLEEEDNEFDEVLIEDLNDDDDL